MNSSMIEEVSLFTPLQEAMRKKIVKGKTKIILVCLCSLHVSDEIIQKVGEALIKLSNKLCLVQQKGERKADHILFGVYQIIKGSSTPLILLNPKDYSLHKFHQACKGLQTCRQADDPYCFDNNEMEVCKESFIGEQLRYLTAGSVLEEWMKSTNTSMTKILFMISSRARMAYLKQSVLESFLGEASADLVEVDFIEFIDPFEESPSVNTVSKGYEETISKYDTATYYDIDVTCGEDLDLFLSYQCVQPILGTHATEITLQFRNNQIQIINDKIKHCVVTPLVLTLEMSPEAGKLVCPCHGRIASLEEGNSEHFFKCSVTNQFVPFERSHNLFKLGNAYWEMLSGDQMLGLDKTPGSTADISLVVLARIKLATLQEALLFGMPFLLSPNMLYAGDEDGLFWQALVTSLKEREECLVVSCHYNFDSEMISITPLKYILMPNLSCGNMLLKRVASYEELLILETSDEFSANEVPSSHLGLVKDMLDDISLCSDITDLSVDIDRVMSDLCKYADSKCSTFK